MLLVHLDHPTPRVRYAVHHVLVRMLGLEVAYAQSLDEFLGAGGPRLNYGARAFEGSVHVPWSGAIDDLPMGDPPVDMQDGALRMFVGRGGEDLFAGIFFLLSLTDEIRCSERDAHGRVPSAALFTVRSGLADRPWVDEQVAAFGDLLERRWPGLLQRTARYTHTVTVDMDNILRYAARPATRAIGASLKDALRGEWQAVAERWRVRSGSAGDPFRKAVERVDMHRAEVDRAIFFFLMRGGTAFDHAADHAHALTRETIRRAAAIGEVGIHPSYATSTDPGRSSAECDALQRIVGKPVRVSRQHFLRWRLPDTLSQYTAAGRVEEHTLGFADRAGFRAGTCTPFPWYDVEREQETSLMLHPFAAMDSALIEKQRLAPDDVVRTMNAMSDLVRAVRGTFISVWHDRYLSGHREFARWPEVFGRVLQHAKP